MTIEQVIPQLPDNIRIVIYFIGLYYVFKFFKEGKGMITDFKRGDNMAETKRQSDIHIEKIYSFALEGNVLLRECLMIAKECVELHKANASLMSGYIHSNNQFKERLEEQIHRINDKLLEVDQRIRMLSSVNPSASG